MSGLFRALRDRLSATDERGFTLIEAIIALTLLALASAGFAVTTNGGLRMIGTSQERQTAVQVASEWMEQARVIPFEGLALPSATTFAGPGTPDEMVTDAGTRYTGEAGNEALVFEAGSTFEHVVSEEVNNILYDAYRYVTWVPDGLEPEAYKRVTIVVQWTGTTTSEDATRRVTLSSIVSQEGVGWGELTVEPVVSDPCLSDTSAPAGIFSIVDGSTWAGYTATSTVTLSLDVTDPCPPLTMEFSNDGTTYSAPVEYSASAPWTLASGEGTRTVWARITDGASNAVVLSDDIVVDYLAPTSCGGDVTPPTGAFAILAGSGASAGYTSSSTVTLSLTASDACAPIEMAFSNDGVTFSTPAAYDTSAVWSLQPGNGERTMWTRFSDGVGNTVTLSSSVVVDGDRPTTPGSFTADVVNAPKRVVLTFTSSTDNEGVIGYRVYVATGSGSFQNQSTGVSHPCPTSPCSWTHAGVKTKDTYTYYVVSYDAAGNESIATSELTRTI